MSRILPTPLILALAVGSAQAAPAGTLAYLKSGAVWVTRSPSAPAREVPGSGGAALLAISPTTGSLALFTRPAGTSVRGEQVPPLTPLLSRVPYTATVPLNSFVPDARLKTVRARWLAFGGDGRHLFAGTDEGTVGWNLVSRQSVVPSPAPLSQSTSADGDVTATLGSVQSPDEPGVLLYGPGARPGTEVFTRRQPADLLRALRAEPRLQAFTAELDPAAQRQDANWVVTPPQVTRDGAAVFFATNAGWGVGSGGTTTYALFRTRVADVTTRALGWIGPLSGSALEVRPSPDGQRLLLLLTRHVSNAQTPTVALVADLRRQTLLTLKAALAPTGRISVLDGACWLKDGLHVALSVAHPRPQELTAANGFMPPPETFTLLLLDTRTGAVVTRVAGATQPACGS